MSKRTDTDRLNWWLLNDQPTYIDGYDIWERMEQDEASGDPPGDDDYLRHARAAIDASMDGREADPQ